MGIYYPQSVIRSFGDYYYKSNTIRQTLFRHLVSLSKLCRRTPFSLFETTTKILRIGKATTIGYFRHILFFIVYQHTVSLLKAIVLHIYIRCASIHLLHLDIK